MRPIPVGRTADGYEVYDRHSSHIRGHPQVQPYVEQALAQISTHGKDFFIEEVTFDAPIGVTLCVQTSPEDDILFAKRGNREGLSRFVKHKEPAASTSLTCILYKKRHVYILETAYVGVIAPPEPWDIQAHVRHEDSNASYTQSVQFWKTHALIYNPRLLDIIPNSEEKESNNYWLMA